MRRALSVPLRPLIFAPLLLAYTAMWLAPATVWYQPESLIISSEGGAEPQVLMTRKIRFSFDGSYTVDVRSAETNAYACGRGGQHRYKGGLDGSYSIGLVDFAGGDAKCASLPEGVYYAEACWTVLAPLWGILPRKTVCISSNPFRVTR